MGLAIEDSVWNQSVFSKNRDWLIEHDALTSSINETVEMACLRGLRSGEHSIVDGTLIQARATHKSTWQNGSNDDRPTEDLHREARSDDTYQSGTDPESHRNRKSQAAPAQPSYLGHVFTDSQHGRVVILRANRGEEDVERKIAAQLLADVAEPVKRITIGADKAHDTGGFVRARRPMNVTPHVAQNTRRKAPPAKSKTGRR